MCFLICFTLFFCFFNTDRDYYINKTDGQRIDFENQECELKECTIILLRDSDKKYF